MTLRRRGLVGWCAATLVLPDAASSGPAERRPPLRDGARFDPRTRSWRRMAAAPIGIEGLSPAVAADGSVYVAVPRNPGVRHTRMDLLAYRLRTDRWDRLHSPPRRNYTLVGVGDRLVASGPSRGPVPLSVFLLGRGERRWKELPRPPICGSLVWDGRRLVLIGFDPPRGTPATRRWRGPPRSSSAIPPGDGCPTPTGSSGATASGRL